MGRVVVRTREKNSHFNRGVCVAGGGGGGGNRGGKSSGKSKGAPAHPVSSIRGGSTPK